MGFFTWWKVTGSLLLMAEIPNPVNEGISYLSTSARFLPSTVVCYLRYLWFLHVLWEMIQIGWRILSLHSVETWFHNLMLCNAFRWTRQGLFGFAPKVKVEAINNKDEASIWLVVSMICYVWTQKVYMKWTKLKNDVIGPAYVWSGWEEATPTISNHLKSHLSRSLDRTVRRTCLKGVMFLFIDLSSHQLTVVICCI